VLGLILALAGIACFLLSGPLFVHTLGFAEKYLSPNQHITVNTIKYIHQVLPLVGVLLLVVGISVVVWPVVFSEMITRLVVLYSNLTGWRFSLVLLWSSSITGLILVASWFLGGGMQDPLYRENGLFETLTAILFMGSSFLLFGAAMFQRRQSADHRKIVAALLVGIGIVFLFFGLEEISWGQSWFGWSTPAVLERINDQGELNVHNLNNSFIRPLYRWGVAAFALVTVAGWLWISRFKKTPLRFLIPHWATAGLLVLMFLFGFLWLHQELLEELGAVFALFYALTALRMSRPRHSVT